MYATINLPGSQHFEYYGPASRQSCQGWLNARTAELGKTELITSLLPQQILPNKEVESWKYRDGSKVIRPGEASQTDADLELTYGHMASRACGCPGEAHYKACPGYQAGEIYARQFKDDSEDTFFVPTEDGQYTVYHFSTAGNPDAHDKKAGEWFFQPSEDAPTGEVWSVGHRTASAAIAAAIAEGQELAREHASEEE